MRRLIYFIAVSADGFIADSSGSFEAFPMNPETLGRIFAEYPETCPTRLRTVLKVADDLATSTPW